MYAPWIEHLATKATGHTSFHNIDAKLGCNSCYKSCLLTFMSSVLEGTAPHNFPAPSAAYALKPHFIGWWALLPPCCYIALHYGFGYFALPQSVSYVLSQDISGLPALGAYYADACKLRNGLV